MTPGDWLGEAVALKVLRNIGDMDPRSERHFLREINIWRNLQVLFSQLTLQGVPSDSVI